MTKYDDGGPAFPAAQYETEHGDKVYPVNSYEGLSIRDWFAGMALQGMITAAGSRRWWRPVVGLNFTHLSRMAYDMADYMLKERNHD